MEERLNIPEVHQTRFSIDGRSSVADHMRDGETDASSFFAVDDQFGVGGAGGDLGNY
jgi:hypothetical protein